MKKLLISAMFVFLLALVPVLAAGDLTLSETTNTVATVDPAGTVQGSFKLTNTGSDTLSNIVTSVTDLTGAGTISASQLSFNPSTIATLASSASQTVSFTLNVPSGQTPGLYTGVVTSTDGSGNEVQVTLQITVNSKPAFEVNQDEAIISTEEDDTESLTIQIENTGNSALSFSASSFSHSIDLEDNDGDAISLSFDPQFTTLNPGDTGSVIITADVEENVDVDTYRGTVTVTAGSATDTFTLEVRVQPELCSDGPVGNLKVTIEEPDSGDDFAPGETIKIEVNVENEDDDDLDVTVEAFLYNVDEDNNLEEVESDEEEVESDDDKDFDLEIKIPTDPDDVSEDDEYILFVKAYEDEDDHCAEDQISINIEREKDDVRVEDFRVSPSTVSCGETVEFIVEAVNVGSNDQDDVYVEIKESELEFDEMSSEFDLEDGESDDNSAIRRFTLSVPSDAREKSYLVEARVFFDDGDESVSDFVTLNVDDCGDSEDDGITGSGSVATASIEVLSSQVTSSGNSFSVPVKVSSNANSQQAFVVTLENTEDWASPVSDKAITLNPGQSSTVYFYVEANSGVAGRQSATVSVRSASGSVIASETFTVNLGEEVSSDSVTGGSVFDGFGNFVSNNSTVFWIIGDIILLIVVIVFLRFLFSRRRN